MLLDSGVILRLNFCLNKTHCAILIAEYVQAKEYKVDVNKHLPFLVDFLCWHHSNNHMYITQETLDAYFVQLYANKTKSYADVIRSYIRSFCNFFSEKGKFCKKFSFATIYTGSRRSDVLHKVYNYYRYLGLTSSARLPEIKKAYHEKVRQFHPDLAANDPLSAERMVSINKIYETLKDEALRLAYDVCMGFTPWDDSLSKIKEIEWKEKSEYLVWA